MMPHPGVISITLYTCRWKKREIPAASSYAQYTNERQVPGSTTDSGQISATPAQVQLSLAGSSHGGSTEAASPLEHADLGIGTTTSASVA